MLSDKPILYVEQDRLNRKDVVNEIILELDSSGSDSTIVGICGKWGSGKTSLMNLLLNELSPDNYIKITFSPWLVRDDVDIIHRFFNTLESALSKGPIGKRKLKKAVKKILKGAAEEYGGWPSILIHAYYEAVCSDNEIAEMIQIKKTISKSLMESKKKCVVAIDDIDRMDKHEIIQIFKFIRNVADFDNVIYLVAYDDRVVSDALTTDAYDGHDYLQKIVDLPIYLPDASRKSIECALRDDFEQITGYRQMQDEVDEQKYYHVFDEMSHLFPEVITTIREEKRVINQFRMKYSLSKKDTYCYDLLALCVIEVKNPRLVDWIKENSHKLCADLSKGEESSKDCEVCKEFMGLNISNSTRALIQYMFPILNGDIRVETITEINAGLNKRICHSEFFDNYFLQISANIYMSESEMEQILTMCSPEDIQKTICRYEGEFETLFDRLYICYLKENSTELPAIIRYLLCDRDLYSGPYRFSPMIHAEAKTFVNHFCMVMQCELVDYFTDYLQKVNIDSMFRYFLVLESCGVLHKESKSQNKLRRLVQAIVSKIENEYRDYPNPLTDPEYYSMVAHLYQVLGQVELCGRIHNYYIKTESDIDTFLDMISKLYSGFDRDITVYLVDPELLEKSHYREKYDKRYWD